MIVKENSHSYVFPCLFPLASACSPNSPLSLLYRVASGNRACDHLAGQQKAQAIRASEVLHGVRLPRVERQHLRVLHRH